MGNTERTLTIAGGIAGLAIALYTFSARSGESFGDWFKRVVLRQAGASPSPSPSPAPSPSPSPSPAPAPSPSPVGITKADYPYGMTIENLGHYMDVNIYIKDNDLTFDVSRRSSPPERQYFLIRYFDPTGKHVKDAVSSLSLTDMADIDPSYAEINNITLRTSPNYTPPGTWHFDIFTSKTAFGQDTTKPLRFGAFTAVTAGKVAQMIDRRDMTI